MQRIVSRPGEVTPLQVDLWQLQLGQITGAEAWLSGAEQAWLEKVEVTSEVGQRFSQSRSLLRWVLSHYVAVPPEVIQLCFSPTGKPHLNKNFHDPAWQFSWSHSGGMAVAAICQGVPVGVDIEQIKPRPRAKQIAQRFFSQPDQAHLRSLSEPEYTQEFLCCWTELEAKLKAVGGKLFQARAGEQLINQPDQSFFFRIGRDYVGTVIALTDQPMTVQIISDLKPTAPNPSHR